MRNLIGAIIPVGLFVLFGCVHTQPQGPIQELPEHALLSARELGRGSYGQSVEAAPDSARLATIVISTVPEEMADKVAHEPALDGVAELIAQVVAREGREIADPIVEHLVWHAGVAAEFVVYAPATARGAGGTQFLDQHLRSLQWPEGGNLIFGIARTEGPRSAQVIVLAAREILMDELPRSVEAGETLIISGRILSVFDELTLLVDGDRSRVLAIPARPNEDGGFEVSVPMPSEPGRRMLEWTGIGESGWRSSLSAFPVYVGMEAPSEPQASMASDVPNPEELSEWEGVVLARINALREEAGARQLSPHPVTSRIAARQAAAFARDPGSAPAPLFEELNTSGLRTLDNYEYRGVTYNLDARISRALERPSVRQMLLNPSMKRMSVAFHPQKDGGHADTWVLTEDLAAFDAGRVSDMLFRDLQRQRGRRGVSELERLPALDALAQAYAARACAEDPEAMAFLEAEARKLDRVLIRGFQVLTSPILHPSLMREALGDPPTAENLLSAHPFVGVAACEMGKPGSPENEWLIFMFAEGAR